MSRCALHVAIALAAAPGFAQVVSYEGNSFPEKLGQGWDHLETVLPADRSIDAGRLTQAPVVLPCPPLCTTQDFYRHELTDQPSWFLTWRMATDGPPVFGAVAPASIVAGGTTGILYHFTIGNNEVRLIRGSQFPIVYGDFDPGVHVFRLELRGADSYTFLVDGDVVDTGVPEGPYPTDDSRVTFGAQAAIVDSVTQWDYIRFGLIPEDASGDFDSDGAVDVDDFYFFQECAANSGPNLDAGPGCRWADMDSDSDVDFHDFALFQRAFTAE